jgi:hypothetical protein
MVDTETALDVTTDKPFRSWPFVEQLTEPEGKAFEALRLWTRAQDDDGLREELESLEIITMSLYELRSGQVTDFYRELPLTLQEQAALETVCALWQRLAKRGEEVAS